MIPGTILNFAISLLVFLNTTRNEIPEKRKPVVIAYVAGFRGLLNATLIESNKLTIINYAFSNIRDGKVFLEREATDTINFRNLIELKQQNRALKILLSVGGWSWSDHFSDVALTDSSRKLFTQSAAEIITVHQLDGLDIDWEYPGMQGEDNTYRDEDKQNFTLLLKAFRNELDELEKKFGKKYLLTIAGGGFQSFLDHTEMYKAQEYLDYVNVMTYDFKTGSDTITGHHTNLFAGDNPGNKSSADQSIAEYIAAGVPANKLVMGIAFYGRAWKTKPNDVNGLNTAATNAVRAGGYSFIKDSLADKNGYKSFWDRKAKAPFLYNADENIFVTYDDENSVKEKCKYVQKHKMAGVMFWEYFADPKGYLLEEINKRLN